MLLPRELPPEVFFFYEEIEKYKINHSFEELEFNKGKTNYNRICKRLEAIKLPNPATFVYSDITLDELKKYMQEILNKIFDNKYQSQIEEYSSMIRPNFRLINPFDAEVEEQPIDGLYTPVKIHISKSLKDIQVVSTAHEIIHCLLAKYNDANYNAHLNNIHYKELLSIMIEYIICYDLSEMLHKPQLQRQHEIIRLDHNQNQVAELTASNALVRQHNMLSMKSYRDYVEHNSYGYILSDIFATRLFTLYQEDPNTLMSMVSSIIDGEKKIKDLLKYYNLSLSNNETVIGYYDKMTSLEKNGLNFTKK